MYEIEDVPNVCVSDERICDDREDCNDRSDESSCITTPNGILVVPFEATIR